MEDNDNLSQWYFVAGVYTNKLQKKRFLEWKIIWVLNVFTLQKLGEKKIQLWELNNVFTLGPNGYTRITEIEIGINLVEGWYYLKYLPDQH